MLSETYSYLQEQFGISRPVLSFVERAQAELTAQFASIDAIGELNQYKVINALQKNKIALRHFSPSTGYGYDDIGRDALDAVFAQAFVAEDALVRPQLASGTHAIAMCLFGLLLPGNEMLSITGKPYDTLEEAIGISGDEWGSLKAYNIGYSKVDLRLDGHIDIERVIAALKPNTLVIYIQRSRGYEWRRSLTVAEIGDAIRTFKAFRPDLIVVVDNCYGEFTGINEPCEFGADVMAGSLIKNPGGGLAPTGGYIAGKRDCIARIANRLTSPGIGREVGSYAASYAPFFQGLFLAPHVVSESLKGAVLCARVFNDLGFSVLPHSEDSRDDIIQAIRFDDEKCLISFCQSIQKAAPIDSHVVPFPWDMPGYQHQVIMAAGAFVQGASIELSADAPMKPPYIAYMQGGLTFDHVKLGILIALQDMIDAGSITL